MPVVVSVLHQGGAVSRNCRCHEFANHAAEVGGHQEGLEPLDVPCAQLRVDKTKEIDEVNRCAIRGHVFALYRIP
jgi:hypothetical protein